MRGDFEASDCGVATRSCYRRPAVDRPRSSARLAATCALLLPRQLAAAIRPRSRYRYDRRGGHREGLASRFPSPLTAVLLYLRDVHLAQVRVTHPQAIDWIAATLVLLDDVVLYSDCLTSPDNGRYVESTGADLTERAWSNTLVELHRCAERLVFQV